MTATGIMLLVIGIPVTALGLWRRRSASAYRYSTDWGYRTAFKGAGLVYFAFGVLCLMGGVSMLLS